MKITIQWKAWAQWTPFFGRTWGQKGFFIGKLFVTWERA